MLSNLIASVTGWIRQGYPQGVPSTDFVPLLALLQRSLSAEQVEVVMGMVIRDHPDGGISPDAVSAAISQVKDAPPSEEDINLVAGRLAAAGWPLAVPEGDLRDVLSGPRKERCDVLQRVLGWLRAGYPQGVPPTDYIPVLAILHRRLSDAEVKDIAHSIIEDHTDTRGRLITAADVQHMISDVTNISPSQDDLDRVRAHPAAQGWPLETTIPARERAGESRDD